MESESHTPGVPNLSGILERQRSAQLASGTPDAKTRIDRIDRVVALLVDNANALVEATVADFGQRSRDMSAFAEIVASLTVLKAARANLKRWMRPERRSTMFPFNVLGGRSWIEYQPKGVVGIIAPWNFPINLAIGPLAEVLAAGNRAMIKPSEFTGATSELLRELVSKEFDVAEIAVVTGGPEAGAAFSALPFDHLLFTGSASIAVHIARAAAERLVPLTLELGGKSPVIVGRSANLRKAAKRIMAGKTLNAGQVCLAPDYVVLPEESVDAFIDAARASMAAMYPAGLKDNEDYASIINQRHFDRLQGFLQDASGKGADLVALNPTGESFAQQPFRKIPPTLVLNATDDMKLMQDEIFGPLLPVLTYRDIGETIAYVNGKPRPLALYYFGHDKGEERRVLHETVSGGAAVNDVIAQTLQLDLPFGGIGASGMGVYHGRAGFREFSHAKSVFSQTGSELIAFLRPPYGRFFKWDTARRISK